MKDIKNADGRLVCQADETRKEIIIILKGFKTVVRFTADGRIEVVNTKPAA